MSSERVEQTLLRGQLVAFIGMVLGVLGGMNSLPDHPRVEFVGCVPASGAHSQVSGLGRRIVDAKSHRGIISENQSKPVMKHTNRDGSKTVSTA
jgi:hypothetical protein